MAVKDRAQDLAASEPLRILEIGEKGLFYWALHKQTRAYFASYRADLRQGWPFFGVRAFWRLLRGKERYDLLAIHPPFYPGWHPRSFLAALKYSLFRGRPQDLYGALVSPLLYHLLRFVPLGNAITIDRSDSFGVPSHHLFLLDRTEAFYKRELPVDRWQAFYASGHRRLPGRSFRLRKRWQRRLDKLRPLGLGIHSQQVKLASAAMGIGKQSDVFFCGGIDGNNYVRADIPRAIERLRAAGVKVDAPEERLSEDEFMRRCAAAWITLSPAGLGWDCYRHMEAALAGSVPLVSVPTIWRYRPMLIGVHCLSYHPDEDRLAEIVVEALGDKERLAEMSRAARQHVLQNLTEVAMCRDLVRIHVGQSNFSTPPSWQGKGTDAEIL